MQTIKRNARPSEEWERVHQMIAALDEVRYGIEDVELVASKIAGMLNSPQVLADEQALKAAKTAARHIVMAHRTLTRLLERER